MHLSVFMHKLWYGDHPFSYFVVPVSWLYRLIITIRRLAFAAGIFPISHLSVPVIVVGNITVGGTGKTPLVIWLANFLKSQGYFPGIISRGYGGMASSWPQQVCPDSDPAMVGDEPVMIARRTGCPLAVSPKRVSAAEDLIDKQQCNVIISDDGLQHLALGRDIEIAVVDSELRYGNERCLPAGPLREPLSRLNNVDLIVSNGKPAQGEFAMSLKTKGLLPVQGDGRYMTLEEFRGKTVHAIAGIGNPARFFRLLRHHDIKVLEHPFPDHYVYSREDISFDDDYPIVMTEKDAVKCSQIGCEKHWYLQVDVELNDIFKHRINTLLKDYQNG